MLTKSFLITILAISLLGCDDDFKQGNCDEGYFQQTDGSGGSFCVPITEEEGVANTMPNAENLNTTD